MLLAAVAAGLACGDATGPEDQRPRDLIISAAGLTSDAAGLMLRIDGAITDVTSEGEDLDLVWVPETAGATVALVGAIVNGAPLLRVRGGAGVVVSIVEIARADGSVAQPPAGARVIARP